MEIDVEKSFFYLNRKNHQNSSLLEVPVSISCLQTATENFSF